MSALGAILIILSVGYIAALAGHDYGCMKTEKRMKARQMQTRGKRNGF